MKDESLLCDMPQETAPVDLALKHWQAALSLTFRALNGRSYLAKKEHSGPLVIQKTLHPEGEALCHGIIIHPPGGVAGGDSLALNVDMQANANALLTTPGAGKWYKANGGVASQHLQFNVAKNARLEWFPQENIIFDGAVLKFTADIQLHESACYAGWDILCFGRLAKGEHWNTGKLKQTLNIRQEKKLIWQEASNLQANHGFFTSSIGMASQVVSGSFVIAAGHLPAELLTQCQAYTVHHSKDQQAKFAVTALPEIFCARYIGMSAQSARQYFEGLWYILRPWYANCQAIRPRIWNT